MSSHSVRGWRDRVLAGDGRWRSSSRRFCWRSWCEMRSPVRLPPSPQRADGSPRATSTRRIIARAGRRTFGHRRRCRGHAATDRGRTRTPSRAQLAEQAKRSTSRRSSCGGRTPNSSSSPTSLPTTCRSRLRKVASFCQLLEKRYGDKLDERGVEYIGFAVDGAKRMQVLINDLLTFSRVGPAQRHGHPTSTSTPRWTRALGQPL